MGQGSAEQSAAREEVLHQLQSPDDAVIPVCLIHESPSQDAAADERQYHNFGSGEINLQVSLACS